MNYLLLMAGGVGSRVGAGVPKQFIEVLGEPIIAYTMRRFQECPLIDAIELICVKGFEEKLAEIARKAGITKVLKIVEGGHDYEHSIINGVKGLEGIAKEDDVIQIHWAAAPFVSQEIIEDNIRVCKAKGNAISSCKPFLLYGTNDGDHADNVIDRDTFMSITAPHSFLYKNIKKMYEDCEAQGLFDKLEAHTTNFMAYLNIPIYFSKGDQSNIKITTKEDVDLFTAFALYEKCKKGQIDVNITL